MREQERFDAQQEALREGFTDLTRRVWHGDAMRTYLAGITYAARPRRAAAARRPARPEERPAADRRPHRR